MINEQVILLIAQTIWLIVCLFILKEYKDLGASILMYSIITEVMGNGIWFKWWVYLLLGIFSFMSRVWTRFNIVMKQEYSRSHYVIIHNLIEEDGRTVAKPIDVREFSNKDDAQKYQDEMNKKGYYCITKYDGKHVDG